MNTISNESRAEIHDRTALLVAIVALAVAVAALVLAGVNNQSSRDRDAALKDDVIRIDGDVQRLRNGIK